MFRTKKNFLMLKECLAKKILLCFFYDFDKICAGQKRLMVSFYDYGLYLSLICATILNC